MKCRMYLGKTQQQQLDNMFYGKAVAHNMLLYNLQQGLYCTETIGEDGSVVHFPDFKKAAEKTVLDEMRHANEFTNYLPGAALSSSKYGVIADIKKAWENTGKHPIEQWDWVKKLPDGREQHLGPQSQSKYIGTKTFAYPTATSNIVITENDKLKIKIASKNYAIDGLIKIKGWNTRLRFDENYTMDFLDYLRSDDCPSQIAIRLERDLDRYYIIFTLNNVYRPYKIQEKRTEHVGMDVGEKTLAVFSDGKMFNNIFDANPRLKEICDSIDYINSILPLKYGYKNEEFRNQREKDKSIKPSNNYIRLQKQQQRLFSKRKDIYDNYYQTKAAEAISKYNRINVESLNIKDMYWYKEKQKLEKEQEGENKKTDSNT